MSTIETVIEKLKKHPDVKYSVKDNRLIVPPQTSDGFHVGIEVGLLLFPFWGRREELFLQNHIIKSA